MKTLKVILSSMTLTLTLFSCIPPALDNHQNSNVVNGNQATGDDDATCNGSKDCWETKGNTLIGIK
jgi:hypothetical protein|tara:strand:- start:125 stop:322 length:198 start_codon:yes stop_codon:yes gene_type:complete